MISRRTLFGGVAALAAPALSGCGGRPPKGAGFDSPVPATPTPRFTMAGLDAVIDISHGVTVTDFAAVRRSGILGVIHKVSEGGDFFDSAYVGRRRPAEAAGLLWGGYHFGTRQYSGEQQAASFLAACQPGPSTLMALDLEPNEGNPSNTMRLAQAEAFVQEIQRATRRLPVVYAHPRWANGERYGKHRMNLDRPVTTGSILARCELWVADYRDGEPETPHAWSNRGWKLWQYAANERESDAAFGTISRAVAGLDFCDRNFFAGDTAALQRFWRGGA